MPLQVSIYAAPEKWQQTHYALEVAVKMLDFFEKYFNILYPLPKQGKLLFKFLGLRITLALRHALIVFLIFSFPCSLDPVVLLFLTVLSLLQIS